MLYLMKGRDEAIISLSPTPFFCLKWKEDGGTRADNCGPQGRKTEGRLGSNRHARPDTAVLNLFLTDVLG